MATTVTSKGQITLPKAVRDALGIAPGTAVDFELRDGGVLVRRCIVDTIWDKWIGYLPAHGDTATTDEIMADLRDSK